MKYFVWLYVTACEESEMLRGASVLPFWALSFQLSILLQAPTPFTDPMLQFNLSSFQLSPT